MRRAKIVAISHLEPELIKRAKKKARDNRRSFSAYVCALIEADLKLPPEIDHDQKGSREDKLNTERNDVSKPN